MGTSLTASISGCALREDVFVLQNRLAASEQRNAQQHKEINGRVDELVSKLDALNNSFSGFQNEQKETGEEHNVKYADVRQVVKELREEMQTLSGRLDENRQEVQKASENQSTNSNQLAQQWDHVEKTVKASSDRIVRLEEYLGLEPSEKMPASEKQPSEGKGGSATTEEQTPSSPNDLYTSGKKHFDAGDYEKARQLFESYLKQAARSENADNAQFWIAEIFFREKWYEKAILEYQKVIESYPKGNKVRSALLKQGLAFSSLNDKDNARLILKELIRKHPGTTEAEIATKKLEELK